MNLVPRLVQAAGLQKAGFSRGKFAFSTIPSMDQAAFSGPLWVVAPRAASAPWIRVWVLLVALLGSVSMLSAQD